MSVVVKLLTSGVDAGPFNLYSNVDGYTTPIAVNIPKATLTAGYTLATVPTGTTLIKATSLGLCGNSVIVGMSEGYVGPATTSTTSTSTTVFNPNTTSTTTSTSTSSTSTSTTSTSTTAYIPYPNFTLNLIQVPSQYWIIKISNAVNGTRFNFNQGATYTNPATCATPMGYIDPDVGEADFNIPANPPSGTKYTVRVYNYLYQSNCSVYTDKTITI